MIPAITVQEARRLASNTNYAISLVSNPNPDAEKLNTTDMGEFFFAGYYHAIAELKKGLK